MKFNEWCESLTTEIEPRIQSGFADVSVIKDKIIQKISELYEDSEFESESQLSESMTPQIVLFLKELAKKIFTSETLSEPFKKKLMQEFVKNSINTKNPFLVQMLCEINPYYENALNVLNISNQDAETLKKISSVENPYFFWKLMRGFSHDVDFTYTYSSMILTAAQVYSRKVDSYEFNPTILESDVSAIYFNESPLKNFFSLLLSSAKPIKERFIYTDGHWISGEVRIDENKNVSVLIMDSTGQESLPEYTKQIKELFLNFFQGSYNTCDIYADPTIRQHVRQICAGFAVDDVRHLYTVEENLIGTTDLFEFLDSTTKNTISYEKGVAVHFCSLPLFLMRTIQKMQLKNDIFEARSTEEKNMVINSKKPEGLTVAESAERNFEVNPDTKRLINRRIEKQLQKMKQFNVEYLLNTPVEQVKREMKRFTMDSLRERLAPAQNESAIEKDVHTNELMTPSFRAFTTTASESKTHSETQNDVKVSVDHNTPKSR